MSCYVASPFFNSAQLGNVQTIEKILTDHKVPFFSPRSIGVLTPKAGVGSRRAILDGNIAALSASSCVLAVLEWLFPEGEAMHGTHQKDDEYGVPKWVARGAPLNLPDTGVVWETGWAYAKDIPIVGIRWSPGGKLNVMLTETLTGVLTGESDVKEFAKRWPDLGWLPRWKGETQ